ncbi:hypothetical protein CP532_2167 [Ophiocordyceps camponoti-leonardi (nom. inval.)]|nr:hypothetical protein CP532_2167 [Ophiocordyceps camponoti-leonardi (nom. inval.)]
MHPSLFIPSILLLLLLATNVQSLPPTPITSSPDPRVSLWTIFDTKGHPHLVNGTIEEAYRAMTVIDPDFKPPSSPPSPEPAAERGSLYARAGYAELGIRCEGAGPANLAEINRGIDYLLTIPGSPMIAGTTSCERVSCSWNSAIWLCNEGKRSLTLSNWLEVARSAQGIVDRCFLPGGKFVMGHSFEVLGWRTVIGHSNC